MSVQLMRHLLSAPPDRHRRTAGTVLLGGWAAYFTVVVASNLSDLASSFGWEHWAFRSGNLDYIAKATQPYFTAAAVNQLLLAAVIVWEAVTAVLLWRAARCWARFGAAAEQARAGLIASATIWFAFAFATELFVAYDRGIDESAYWTLAAATLASLAVLELINHPANTPQMPTSPALTATQS